LGLKEAERNPKPVKEAIVKDAADTPEEAGAKVTVK